VRIYGIRHWIEQGCKQVKDELGWADFQVRSDIAIRRHQALINCAFCFCWDTWLTSPPPPGPAADGRLERGHRQPAPAARARQATPPEPSWPHALRAVRSWLTPAITLTRWWQAWSKAPPPAELRHLIDNVTLGQGLYLYLSPYSNGLPLEGCCDPSEGPRSSACPRDLPGVVFGLNGGECGHYLKPMNTAAPDLGGVLRVHGEVPMSGYFCQPFRPGG
jgi:hypothetical protein